MCLGEQKEEKVCEQPVWFSGRHCLWFSERYLLDLGHGIQQQVEGGLGRDVTGDVGGGGKAAACVVTALRMTLGDCAWGNRERGEGLQRCTTFKLILVY